MENSGISQQIQENYTVIPESLDSTVWINASKLANDTKVALRAKEHIVRFVSP